MGIIEYKPEHFEIVREAAEGLPQKTALVHRCFMDYYYTDNPWCKLCIFQSGEGAVGGLLGMERMRFEHDSREMMISFGSNYYALQTGVGGLLFRVWMKHCPVAMVFGGSEDTHRVLQSQNWKYYSGVKLYFLNRSLILKEGEEWWKSAAKRILNPLNRMRTRRPDRLTGKIAGLGIGAISVREEKRYAPDLFPEKSPFTFHFSPTLEHLEWRYGLDIPFLRYRLFRILLGEKTAGYVILNDAPERIIVSHCDGEDPETLAFGVILSLIELMKEEKKSREALLASCHPVMQRIYESMGFRPSKKERPFVLGSLKKPPDLPPDTSNWLVNFDWGDNGLRPEYFRVD